MSDSTQAFVEAGGRRRASATLCPCSSEARTRRAIPGCSRGSRRSRRCSGALGTALDIREVFGRVSEVTRAVLPHDALGLALLDEDGIARAHLRGVEQRGFRAAGAHRADRGRADACCRRTTAAEVVDDISVRPGVAVAAAGPGRLPRHAPRGDPSRRRRCAAASACSRDRWARSRPRTSRCCNASAEYVGLALSHQRLAEAAARAAEARERATRLERRVEALTRELASLSRTDHRIVGKSQPWRAVLEQASRVAPTETTVLLTGESGTGQGTDRAAHSPRVASRQGTVRRDQLRGAARAAARERTVRRGTRGVHGRGAGASGPAGAGGGRHAVPGRGRGDEPRRAGQAAARAAGARVPATGRPARAARRRARDRRHQPRPARARRATAASARTCSTACTCSKSRCRRCASAPTTSSGSRRSSSKTRPRRWAVPCPAFRRTRGRRCCPTRGRATCAN